MDNLDTKKILKAGFAAALSAYAAKKDPYMFKGFADKMEEFDKEDRAARRSYIEKSSEGIGKILAENAAKRKERISDYSSQIDQLTEYTKDKYISASMIKAGLYKQMLAKATTGTDIKSLFKTTQEFEGDRGNLSTAQLAELLAGKPKAAFPDEKFIAPAKTSPLSKFISGDEVEDITKDVRKQTQALVPDAFNDGDTDEIDAEITLGGNLTKRGKQFFSPKVSGDLGERATNNTIVNNILAAIGGTRKTQNTSTGLLYQYDSEIEEKKIIANDVKDDIFAEIIELQKEEQGMTRATATQIILNKYNFGKSTTTHPDLIKYIEKKNPTDTETEGDKKEVLKKQTLNSLVNDLKDQLAKERQLDKYYKTGQGGRKFKRQKYMVYQENKIAELVKNLSSEPSSKYYNKPAEAREFILKKLVLGLDK